MASPDDIAGFAAGIDAMTLNGRARSAAVQAGLQRAAGYTWRRTASEMARFFREVLTQLG